MINPFRIHGAVTGGYFTNRAAEIKRIAETLREPSAKLLVFGERQAKDLVELGETIVDARQGISQRPRFIRFGQLAEQCLDWRLRRAPVGP